MRLTFIPTIEKFAAKANLSRSAKGSEVGLMKPHRRSRAIMMVVTRKWHPVKVVAAIE